MRTPLLPSLVSLALLGAAAGYADQPPAAPAAKSAEAAPAASSAAAAGLATDDEQALYAVGLSIWRSLSTLALTPDELKLVERGLEDAAAGREPAVSLEEAGPKIQAFRTARIEQQAKQEEKQGQAYLDAAAAKPGAVKTDSGMVYIETEAGTGDSPTATDTVKVHYTGTLVDGTVFDSSVKRGQPVEFPLNRVIACWTEGLQKMKVGGKAQLICPAQLAYGERGRPGIPPGATLVFDVQLLDIIKK
jgi:FKBP-type peptidyl-prolyl cis-trans isomerase FkpA